MSEFLGKKSLLQISGFGMVILLFLMNVAYDNEIANHDERFLLKLIFVYIFFYSIGYGPIPWILMPQMSPKKVSEQFSMTGVECKGQWRCQEFFPVRANRRPEFIKEPP